MENLEQEINEIIGRHLANVKYEILPCEINQEERSLDISIHLKTDDLEQTKKNIEKDIFKLIRDKQC